MDVAAGRKESLKKELSPCSLRVVRPTGLRYSSRREFKGRLGV